MAGFSEKLGQASIEIRARMDKLRGDLNKASTAVKSTATRMANQFKASFAQVGIAAGVASAAVVGLTQKIDDVIKASRRTGFEFEFFQRLGTAAELAGSSIPELESGLILFTRRLTDLEQGLSEATEAFTKLEVASGRSIDKTNRQQAFLDTIDALRQIKDETTRAQLALELFGRQGAGILNLVNVPLDEFEASMASVSVVSEQTAERMEMFNDNLTLIKTNLTAFVANLLGPLVESFNALGPALQTGVLGFTALAGAVALVGGPITAAVVGIGALIVALEKLMALTGGPVENMGEILEDQAKAATFFGRTASKAAQDTTDAFEEMYIEVVGNSFVPDMVEEIGQEIMKLDKLMVTPTIRATDDVSGAFEKMGSNVGNVFGGLGRTLMSGGNLGEFLANAGTGLITNIGQQQLFNPVESALGDFFGGFFANGGQPPVGKTSIVGERGPELFVPKTAGTIVPNGGFGGGSTVVMNNNFAGVDSVNRAELARALQIQQKQVTDSIRRGARNGGTFGAQLRGE